MTDFSRLNHLPMEVKQIIVTGQSLIDQANATLKDRYCNFDLTSKRQLKGDCRKVEKCIQTIVDGKVTELDGEGVTLPSYDELKGNFSFAESNFKNVTTQGNSLSADVESPSSFYGSTVNVQNMKVTVEYTETALSKIVITYQTANSTVTTTYEFAV